MLGPFYFTVTETSRNAWRRFTHSQPDALSIGARTASPSLHSAIPQVPAGHGAECRLVRASLPMYDADRATGSE